MKAPNKQREAGVALILALISMTIIAGAIRRVLLYSEAHRETSTTLSQTLQNQQRIRAQITARTETRRGCSLQSISTTNNQPPGSKAARWWRCSRGILPLVTSRSITLPPGRVDYDTLFTKASPCPGEISDATTQYKLTAPHAGKTCSLPTIIEGDVLSTLNIHSKELTVRSTDPRSTITIASAGSLECEGTITLSSSTLIIAGGDIRIASLVSSSSNPISVTILSAHGDVLVNSVSTRISLLGIGRRLLALPPTAGEPLFPLPPFIPPPISGIYVDGFG